MLMIAVVLNLGAALGMAAIAAKYFFGPAPADYHNEILRAASAEIDSTHQMIFGALNKALGSAMFALTIAIAAITVFGVYQDMFWAKALVVIMGIIFGLPSTMITYRVNQKTGVTTPWKPALALTVTLLVAFLFSVI